MAVWYITCATKDHLGTIVQVGMGQSRDGSNRANYSKAHVVGVIASGNAVYVPAGPTGLLGDPQVRIVHGEGGPYLRTDANDELGDNLGSLPSC